MFLDLFEIIIGSDDGTREGVRIEEVLTKAEVEKLRSEIATPEILPCAFDVTFPGWLARIDTWGDIIIYHKDPEKFWGKKKVTKKRFLDAISNVELNRVLGQWEMKKKGLTKVSFYRDYIDIKGKQRREEFIISVKLRKELR